MAIVYTGFARQRAAGDILQRGAQASAGGVDFKQVNSSELVFSRLHKAELWHPI